MLGFVPFPPIPNGALPPLTLILGTLMLLKILPTLSGKNPLILFTTPFILL
jgi:hypothetical protein